MKKIRWFLLIAVLVIVGVFALRPRPLATPVSEVRRGDLKVEIVEDGVTRVKEKYIVAAPMTGTLRRIQFHAGDPVKKGQIIAYINWFREWQIRAPASGFVLRVIQASETDIEKGRPIMEIGDPKDLEIVLDVLTEKAILVKKDMPVLIEKWGGDFPLHGRVSQVEPSAFNKISSLGVEEQRTNIIVQFTDPPALWQNLGDNFYLEGHIVIEEKKQVLKIPRSALFRNGESWALFKAEGGKAHLVNVAIGAQGTDEAELLQGPLREGDWVVPYPSQELKDGSRIRPLR